MKLELEVGQQLDSDGSSNILRSDRQGSLIVSELHGKYAEQTARGNVFCATTASATVLTTGVACGPLCLYNPPGSGKNLYLIRAYMFPTVSPGTQTTGIFGYYTAAFPTLSSLTAGTINASIIGSGTRGVGQVYTAATLAVAPTLFLPFATKFGTTNPASTFPTRVVDDVDGQIVILQGGFLTIQESVVDTTSNFLAVLSYVWEEVPA